MRGRGRRRLRGLRLVRVLVVVVGVLGLPHGGGASTTGQEGSVPRQLTEQELQQLRRVASWELEYEERYERDVDAFGTEGSLGCCWDGRGPVTGWTIDVTHREHHTAKLTIAGQEVQSDCSSRVMSPQACVPKLEDSSTVVDVLEHSRLKRAAVSIAEGEHHPACEQVDVISHSAKGTIRGLDLRYPQGEGLIYFDYGVNPPAAGSTIRLKPMARAVRVTQEGCLSTATHEEDQDWVVDFGPLFSLESETETSRRVQVENGRFVVRGSWRYEYANAGECHPWMPCRVRTRSSGGVAGSCGRRTGSCGSERSSRSPRWTTSSLPSLPMSLLLVRLF